MWAVTDHLFISMYLSHSFQEDLLHDLAGYRSETDWPVVPRLFLFSLFKNGCYVSPFSISGNFTGLQIFTICFLETRELSYQLRM